MTARSDYDQLVPDYVLGFLSEADRRRMDAALAGSDALRREVDETREALAAASASALAPVTPHPTLRQRIVGQIDGVDRFRPFFAELARILELPIAAVRTLLAKIDDRAGWLPIKPGIWMFGFEPGQGPGDDGDRQANFLRLAPGAAFPRHQHLGPELAFVLEGAGHDEDGRRYGPGAIIAHPTGSAHGFHAGDRRDLCLVVVHHGITFL